MGVDAKQRIRELLTELNWSEYRLAIESGLSQSTVANIFNRNTTPSVATLEMICKGFGITLAQFFAEGSMVELTEEQQTMFEAWRTLSPEQKAAISHLISVMKKLRKPSQSKCFLCFHMRHALAEQAQ